MNNRNHNESSDTPWEGWDDQEVWDGINEALDKKAKRRLLPFFIFIGIASFISVNILLHYTNSKSETKSTKPITQNIQNEKFKTNTTSDDQLCPSLIIPSQIAQINQLNETSDLNSYSYQKNINKTQAPLKAIINKIKKDVDRNLHQATLPPFQVVNDDLNEEVQANIVPHRDNNIVNSIGQIPWQFLISNIVNKNQISYKLQASNSVVKFPAKTSINKSRFDIYFDHGIGLGHTVETVDINIPWQKMTDENERYLYSTFNQIYGVKTFRNGWNISTGLSYLRHISRLQGSTQTISIVAFESDSARVQEINGLTYYHSGQLTKTITKNEVYNVYNTHSLMQIPIQIGYAFRLKNNIVRITAGTNYTIAQFVKGYAFEGANQITSYDKLGQQQVIKSNGLNNLNGSINWLYPMTKKIGLNFGFDITMPTKANISITDGHSKDYKRGNTVYFIKLGMVYNIKNL